MWTPHFHCWGQGSIYCSGRLDPLHQAVTAYLPTPAQKEIILPSVCAALYNCDGENGSEWHMHTWNCLLVKKGKRQKLYP